MIHHKLLQQKNPRKKIKIKNLYGLFYSLSGILFVYLNFVFNKKKMLMILAPKLIFNPKIIINLMLEVFYLFTFNDFREAFRERVRDHKYFNNNRKLVSSLNAGQMQIMRQKLKINNPIKSVEVCDHRVIIYLKIYFASILHWRSLWKQKKTTPEFHFIQEKKKKETIQHNAASQTFN